MTKSKLVVGWGWEVRGGVRLTTKVQEENLGVMSNVIFLDCEDICTGVYYQHPLHLK